MICLTPTRTPADFIAQLEWLPDVMVPHVPNAIGFDKVFQILRQSVRNLAK